MKNIDRDMLNRALDKFVEAYIKENDLEKVRHGKWIGIPHKMYSPKHGFEDIICEYKCSICGNVQNAKYIYCSFCGAKMDGKD